jgi:hypothetical protein
MCVGSDDFHTFPSFFYSSPSPFSPFRLLSHRSPVARGYTAVAFYDARTAYVANSAPPDVKSLVTYVHEREVCAHAGRKQNVNRFETLPTFLNSPSDNRNPFPETR